MNQEHWLRTSSHWMGSVLSSINDHKWKMTHKDSIEIPRDVQHAYTFIVEMGTLYLGMKSRMKYTMLA